MQQPSAQGIASLYMGNPGALQQRIQKDQQAKPGLPPDLKQLMALNIVTNEQDAAKRQQAMNALNSMAPAGQQPPTVAQSIQEQAKQKLQAQMMQQQRQQQGLMELAKQQAPSEMPENVPQPERQPQGIDELPVEMQLAGGGIVAFSKGDTAPEPTREELEEQRRKDAEKLKALRGFLGDSGSDIAAKLLAAGADIATIIPRGLAGAVDTALIRPARAMGADIDYISPALTPGPQRSDTATPFYDRYIRAREQQAPAAAPAVAPKAAPSPQDLGPVPGTESGPVLGGTLKALPDALKEAVEKEKAAPRAKPQPRPTAAPTAAPVAPTAADVASGAAVGEVGGTNPAAPATGLNALYEANMRKRMALDPNAAANAAITRYKEMVGEPDVSQYDRMVAELEGRKKQLEAPKPGWDAFIEYMGKIAEQGPQRKWYEAGAKGAAAQTALNRERQAQQFDLTKQGIDVLQKKLEAQRGFKKDMFTLSEKERDDIDKQVQDATKEYGLSVRDAERFKRDLELEALRNKNAVAIEGIRAKNAAAGRPFDVQGEYAKAVLAGDEKRAAKLLQALQSIGGAKRPGLDMELLKKFENLPGVKNDMEMLSVLRSIKSPKPEQVKQMQDIEARLVSKARSNGLDPEQVGLTTSAPVESGPKVGDIQDGYKFLGGNPGDPKSWQKV